MRIIHIIGGMLVLALFAGVLFSAGNEFVMEYNESDVLFDNDSARAQPLFNAINKSLDTIGANVGEAGSNVPSGSDFEGTESGATDATNQGLGFVTAIGELIFTLPKELLTSLVAFLGLPPIFSIVIAMALVTVVSLLLANAFTRNRL